MDKILNCININSGGIIKTYSDYSKYLLNFKIIDNKLYLYNSFEKEEYRNYIEIKRINNKRVSTLIKLGLTPDDLLDPENLLEYGIDVSNKYILKLKGYKKFNIYEDDEERLKFRREHKKSQILKVTNSKQFKENKPSNNPMLDYASTAYKSMLNSLYNLSKTDKDKELFQTLIDDIKNINDNFSDMNTSMNIAYLSTALLLGDKDYDYIPDYIINIFVNAPSWGLNKYQFVDEKDILENNYAVVTDNKIDPKKIIIMTRNAIAHSNYEVINNEYIRVFNIGKNKFNIYMPINLLLYILKELNGYYTFYGLYPTLMKEFNEIETISKDTIDEFLDKIKIHIPSTYELKHYKDRDMNDLLDVHMKLNVADARRELNFLVMEDTNKMIFDRYIHPHLKEESFLKEIIVDEKLKEYIKRYIEMTDSDYFYNKIARSTQEDIIANIIKQKINKKSTYFNQVLDSIMINSALDFKSLNVDSRSYITYLPEIELTILSLLNIFFCYSHNHNKSNVDTTTLRFPNYFYERELMSKVDKVRQLTSLKTDIRTYITYLLVNKPNSDKIEQELKRTDLIDKKVEFTEVQINYLNNILENRATTEQYLKIHEDMLTRIRDSIAHGNVILGDIDINDIGSTTITFIDKYKEITEFVGTITLKDLLETISNKQLIEDTLNDNQHFKNHVLTKRV